MADAIISSRELVASEDASLIANQLLIDSQICNNHSGLPSPLAAILRDADKNLIRRISQHIGPDALHADVKALLLESIRDKILGYVRHQINSYDAIKARKYGDEEDDFERLRDWKGLLAPIEGGEPEALDAEGKVKGTNGVNDDHAPTEAEIRVALRVLKYKSYAAKNEQVYRAAYEALKSECPPAINRKIPKPYEAAPAANWKSTTAVYESSPSMKKSRRSKRSCYICLYTLVSHHPMYQALCQPCGDFNLAGSTISLPSSLKLPGKNCLVTGARINLGYHTALRLLRCGARVIATSRYPFDAQIRYQKEEDYDIWQDRLKIIGADFRSAKDAFALVRAAKRVIEQWGGSMDILINNAAQTLTDSIQTEEQSIKREVDLSQNGTLVIEEGYKPRVRGGGPLKLLGGSDVNLLSYPETAGQVNGSDMVLKPDASSWVQSLSQIPYEDVISAHSINTFVPLILIRELLPLMGKLKSPGDPPGPTSKKPLGYIINVSSREGIFEDTPDDGNKSGKHVHTNMSKAALNMITETEAAVAWRQRRVGMNTVDPGYMSAAPEYDDGLGTCPIRWEDGAARVLWPIAMGEREAMCVWGRFLKHFGAKGVDVGRGR